MWTTDSQRAFDVQSRGTEMATHPSRWQGPSNYVAWLMGRYKNDDRLPAIEVMTEPSERREGSPCTIPLAKAMFKVGKSIQGKVPLTFGTARIKQAEEFSFPRA